MSHFGSKTPWDLRTPHDTPFKKATYALFVAVFRNKPFQNRIPEAIRRYYGCYSVARNAENTGNPHDERQKNTVPCNRS